ncbi:MAG: endonuclease/exonuclease/phosphatase family protein, partial [Pseudaminobacter sp.]|nr:endonuclease/exonuclease/phosphatase family protein [Pseudaminobacter sp.]
MISLLGLAAAVALSLPLVLGFFAAVHPAFDSFAHFRVHLAVLMALCALPMLAGSMFKEAAVTLSFAVAAIATVSASMSLPGLGQVHAAQPSEQGQPVYRLLQMNLRFDNPDPARILSLIGRMQPDVITLNEVSDMWAGKLALLSAAYPHRIVCPFPGRHWGVAILSRRPFAAGENPACEPRGSLAIAPIDFGGRVADVAAVHLAWPWPFEQARQLDALSPRLATLGETALLAGDMNATPWSAAVARVAKAGGLTLMRSPGATWLSRRLPDCFRTFGLPLDQVFAKGDVMVGSVRTLEDSGSDHRPVLV